MTDNRYWPETKQIGDMKDFFPRVKDKHERKIPGIEVMSEQVSDYIKHRAPRETFGKYTRIDSHPLDLGSHKNQEGWIRYANDNGIVIAAAPDLYRLGQSGDTDLISRIRGSMRQRLCASDRVFYNEYNNDATIIPYFGLKNAKQRLKSVEVPTLRAKPIRIALSEVRGHRFLQEYFETQDSEEAIMFTLEKLSGIDKYDIYVWTTEQGFSRGNKPKIQAYFMLTNRDFRIICDIPPNCRENTKKGPAHKLIL